MSRNEYAHDVVASSRLIPYFTVVLYGRGRQPQLKFIVSSRVTCCKLHSVFITPLFILFRGSCYISLSAFDTVTLLGTIFLAFAFFRFFERCPPRV